MPVITTEKNLDLLTLTIVAEFAAPLRRLWDAYMTPGRSNGSGDRPRTPPRSSATTPSRAAAASTG
ncbi:hypothetical protein [uncultured Arthrobacter sp.]|uniref:hypothetical protein n=1 Tax=uncultured Arthrobacter sp. TaxID=114050 RepID=UPI00345CB28F